MKGIWPLHLVVYLPINTWLMLWPDSILAVPKEKIMDSQPMVLRMISLILHLLPIAIQTGKVRITVGRRNVRQVFISMAVMLMIIATCLILIIVVMARLCSARITVFGIHGLSGLVGIFIMRSSSEIKISFNFSS